MRRAVRAEARAIARSGASGGPARYNVGRVMSWRDTTVRAAVAAPRKADA